MNLTHFKFYGKEEVLQQTRLRKFETKLGEVVQTMQPGISVQKELDQSTAGYVVFGIPEDIGIKANLGSATSRGAWNAFLDAFLNTQSNDFLEGEEVLLLGHFDFTEVEELVEQMALNADEKTGAYRHAVNSIDDAVEGLVKLIVASDKIPIVIGGGHNNAYPCIKGAAKGLAQTGQVAIPQINAINLDAHSGYAPTEGRHSGNAFRYAEEDGYLEKYCVVGIQEACLPQNVWMDIVNNPFTDCITFEDIYVRNKRSFVAAVEHAIDFTDDTHVGIELDMNILQQVEGINGITAMHARQYLNLCGRAAKVAYLHIAEGAGPQTTASVGQLTAYLVSDFVKAVEEIRD
ncbi:formiminoglutamase [Cnuella takakiae]|uniref:Formiminoglutamase n=1 Tax=Cnuella takakiae TaxID=1302690 RepID=A0A1M4V9A0_9BACT|nr:arginase family protein [Cnuella takakiae]OLY92668.1 arginase [Cnuella takakiae]SHE65470.1 formiminoglutamase [Cnuella takakiae]